MAAEYSAYPEDEVYKITKNGFIFGLLVDTGEFASSDDDDDDNDAFPRLRKGTVSVAWYPKGDEEIINPNLVHCADRSLMPGDSIRRMIAGKNSQRGCVKDIRMICHLHIVGSDSVILNVDTHDISSLNEWDFEPGLVTMDSWVGNVEYSQQLITVRFNDGAILQVPDMDLSDFTDINEKRDDDTQFCNTNFHIGQILEGNWDMMKLADVKWIHQTKVHGATAAQKDMGHSFKVTVSEIEYDTVEVHWMCRGYATVQDPNEKLTPPPRIIKGDDIQKLKKFNSFEHLTVQIGDKGYYKIKDSDEIHQVVIKRNVSMMNTLIKSGKVTGCVKPELLDSALVLSTERENELNARNASNLPLVETTLASGDTVIEVNKDAKKDELADVKKVELDQTTENDVSVCDRNGDLQDKTCDNCANGITAIADEVDEGMEADSEDDGSSSNEENIGDDVINKRRRPNHRRGPMLKSRNFRSRKARKCKRKSTPEEPRTVTHGDSAVVEVLYTTSYVDVLWQDGTVEKNIHSPDLFPVHHIEEQEFFPGDFVVVSKTEEIRPNDEYGAILKVDHHARTCLVKWIKPYQVGKNSRPDESIVPEEMSFYDIKEHPDYQFSPDQVVVRVGGYEEGGHTQAAAGQILEVIPDGTLRVCWADATTSCAYPQEVFYVNDEMSEMGSSDDMESVGSDSSIDSWQTEEEITDSDANSADDKTDGNKDSKKDHREVPMKAEDKIEFDEQLDKAKEILEKLQLFFSSAVDIRPRVADCYKNILHAYKSCQDLDRITGTSFFTDPNSSLMTTINRIRKEIRKEKVLRMKKQVMQLFRANTGCDSFDFDDTFDDEQRAIPCGDNITSDLPAETSDISGSDTRKNCDNPATAFSLKDYDNINISSTNNGDMSASTVPNKDITNTAVSHTDDKKSQNTKDGKESSKKGKQRPKNLAISRPLHDDADEDLDDCDKKGDDCDKKGAIKDSSDEHEPEMALSQVNIRKAKLLCEKACHCLKDQIQKLQLELDRIWMQKISHLSLGLAEGDENEIDMEIQIKDVIAGIASALASSEEQAPLQTPMTPITPSKLLSPLSPDPSLPMPELEDRFSMLESAPDYQRFKLKEHIPNNRKVFFSAIKREIKLLRSSLPRGIIVKGFEDRMDLYTVLIVGPANTPYEDGLFLFDVQLPNSYPSVPPSFHYLSYCEGRLNPNLYEEGKVCVSLLGTWEGKGTELWNSHSNLLQVLVSIQGLILNAEPYYNEAGYDRQRGTQVGCENSKVYNEMAVLKLVQSMICLIRKPPKVMEQEILDHFKMHGYRLYNRVQKWIKLSAEATPSEAREVLDGACGGVDHPEFPLIPASRGFCLTIKKNLQQFKEILDKISAM